MEFSQIIRIIGGYTVSIFVGWFLLYLIIDKLLWEKYIGSSRENYHGGKGKTKKKVTLLTYIIGGIERTFYTTILISNWPIAWIGFWLALKTAGEWKRWSHAETRASYYIFLIGSALSILMGYIGAWIILNKPPAL